MNNFNQTALPCISFAKVYERNIESKIKEIDIYLKTETPPYKVEDVSDLLHIETADLISTIKRENITTLNIVSFFTIIQTSSSYICQLIQREWKYQGLKHYTPEAISYIYDLNLDKVRHAFKESGLSQVDSDNIKQLFEHISVPIMNF